MLKRARRGRNSSLGRGRLKRAIFSTLPRERPFAGADRHGDAVVRCRMRRRSGSTEGQQACARGSQRTRLASAQRHCLQSMPEPPGEGRDPLLIPRSQVRSLHGPPHNRPANMSIVHAHEVGPAGRADGRSTVLLTRSAKCPGRVALSSAGSTVMTGCLRASCGRLAAHRREIHPGLRRRRRVPRWASRGTRRMLWST